MPVRRRTGEDGGHSDHGSHRGSPRSRPQDGRTPLKAPHGGEEEAAKAVEEPMAQWPGWATDWADQLAATDVAAREAEADAPEWAYQWAEELIKPPPTHTPQHQQPSTRPRPRSKPAEDSHHPRPGLAGKPRNRTRGAGTWPRRTCCMHRRSTPEASRG